MAYGQFPSIFQNPGGDPMHQGGNLAGGGNGNGQHVAMQYIKPCFPMPCMIQCKNGYRTGPGGCQYCYCNPAPGLLILLIDFSLTVKAANLIFISGRGSSISSAKEGFYLSN